MFKRIPFQSVQHDQLIYAREAPIKRLNVPVQAIGPFSRQKLRYLFHILVASSRHTDFWRVSLEVRKQVYTHDNKVGLFGQRFCSPDPSHNACDDSRAVHRSGPSARQLLLSPVRAEI